ncbi:sigma-54-dependent transcriptional regulator [Marivita geojedonensis]|uniref:Nif-specific regulatory protein n=1 Tax=Marivita geojedonensis TaxID=1123756 RepID=A0A1X4NLJ6_9RHOB|nr:sigma-54 dependent transcriptional regulator [Marivita geojedonensis]OSQ51184.1 Fis family transcriptional regulator [Marivita geojedonensis]PRY78564.1 two-component system C4-dicarboxylate transport response regulator DctD [Marivita geojedonensis]
MSATGPVLFVDDEEPLRIAAQQTLELADLDCLCFDRAAAALTEIGPDFPGILVSDIRMPGMDGTELLRAALRKDPEFPVILVTGHGDLELAVAMMREGAYDFIEKPYAPERLVDAVRRALTMRRLTIENRQLRSQVAPFIGAREGLRGFSPEMERVRKQINAVAASDADVLIVGETGTGKGLAAQALHAASARSDKPFVAINCAALPADMIESELFGHEPGAFVGATRARAGKFEHARRGAVFLDEIDSLPLALQAKLLHAVETRSINRLGSHDPIDLDVRFVAASKSDLEAAAAKGTFRSDLLYRLNVVTVRMPSLAARREDIPMLFLTFVRQMADRYGQPVPQVPGAVLDAIASRDWLGNARELRNAAERYVLGLHEGEEHPSQEMASLAERVAAHERALIAASLAANGGRLKDTYEALGISRKALYEKMQRYGLDRDSFVEPDT